MGQLHRRHRIHGRFVGTRDGDVGLDRLRARAKAGGKAGGQSNSRIETDADGRLRLVEEFRFKGDDTRHVSVCTEVVTA